jgi:hypothetical protein
MPPAQELRSIRPPRLLVLATALMLVTTAVPGPMAGATPQVRKVVATQTQSVNVRDLARVEGATKSGQRPAIPVALPISLNAPATRAPASRPIVRPSLPRVVGTWPGFSEQVAFAGMADAAVGGATAPVIEPPDPWVAVGPSHLVQAVNTRLRFSTRQGNILAEVSLKAFFGEPGTQVLDGDSRVVYDRQRGRWFASELSADCGTGHLHLAVSDSGDPTMGWHSWDFSFPGELPDYPGFGFSSDKVALSANVYSWSGCATGAFVRSDLVAIDWTDILDGGGLSAGGFSNGSITTWRPAPNLTADATLRVVGEGPSGEVVYGTLTGTSSGANLVFSSTDLTTAGTVDAFAMPPQPQDPLGTLGPAVLDSRPTDALWQNGHLWFVSTYPFSYDAGTTYHDTVRVTELTTSGTPALAQDFLIGSPGLDDFLGGIGLSQAGGLYTVYSESGPSSYVSLHAAFQSPGATPNSITGSRLLAPGAAGYKGDRWGDYVGVAIDPVYPYAVWQAGEYANGVGSWSTRVSMLNEDRSPPTVTARSPLANATNVSLSPTVTAQFSEAVTGVSTTNMALSNVANLVNLPATVTYDPATRTASLHPASPLLMGATYRVALSGRITDVAGNPLAWTTWTFSTAAPVSVKLGSHTGYQFNASGALTAIKTFTLPSNSSTVATRRQAITRQSGTWLAISSGVWAGYWMRESSVLYLSASPISAPPGSNMTFSPPASLTFKLGTHTGYRFSPSGGLTAQKTFTLANNSTALTTKRSTSSAQSGKWFMVSSGVWAGYWVRSSDVIYLTP